MAYTAQQRSEIYAQLADRISPQGAEFLMAQAPPGGWEQFATKADLKELAAEMTTRFAAVDVKMTQGFAELDMKMERGFAEINSRFAEMDSRFAKLTEQRGRDVWAFSAAMAVMVITVVVSVFLAG